MLEKLAKQTAIYGISTIVVRFLNYLLTPYYTRIFDQGEYGIITDIYALIPFALVLLSMGMESSYFRFTTRAEEAGGDVAAGKRKVFATTWGITALAAILFFVVVWLLNDPISKAMGADYVAHPEYVTIVAAIVMVDVWTMIPFSRLREQGRAMRFVLLKALSVLLNVGLAIGFGVAGLYSTTFGVGWVLIANLAASIITLIALLPSTERVRPRIDWALLRRIFVYSLPLLISGIAGTANEFIDRQMIKYLAPGTEAEAMAELLWSTRFIWRRAERRVFGSIPTPITTRCSDCSLRWAFNAAELFTSKAATWSPSNDSCNPHFSHPSQSQIIQYQHILSLIPIINLLSLIID